MNENESLDTFIGKLLGIDVEAEKKKRVEEFTDYFHLLQTLTPEQFHGEIGSAFAPNWKQCAIMALLYEKIRSLYEGKE